MKQPPISDSHWIILLHGDKSGRFITQNHVALKGSDPNAADQPLGARQPTAVMLNFQDTNNLLPDHYVGTINFGVDGSEVQPTVNYSVDVRDAPWLALGVLLLGVIVGRLVKSMNSPEAITQLKLIRRLYRLQKNAFAVKNTTDRANILAELDAIKQRINAAEEPEAVLTAELDQIETRIKLLSKLEYLQTRIALVQDPTLKQELANKCMSASQALREGRIEDSATFIKEIVSKLEAQPTPLDASGESFSDLLDYVREVDDEGAAAVAASKAVTAATPGCFTRALAWLSGASFINAEVRYWLVRPVFFLLLLFLLGSLPALLHAKRGVLI